MTPTSTALALAGLSFILTVIWGDPLLRILRYFKFDVEVQAVNPQRQIDKTQVPTMGGVLVILPVVLLTAVLNAVSLVGFNDLGLSILLPLIVMLCYAALGFANDWLRSQGMKLQSWIKFLIQVAMGLVTAYGLQHFLNVPELYLPFFKSEFELNAWYIPVAMVVIVGTTSAVNKTGGVDGLPGLVSATAFAVYGAIAAIQGQMFIAQFCFTVTGALFGFLWFNIKPAALMMGNTGKIALGATLAVIALMTGHWALLPLIAIIPLAELGSVLLQEAYSRWTGGRRIFRRKPLHNHYKVIGWSDAQILQRFWLFNLLFAMMGITLAMV